MEIPLRITDTRTKPNLQEPIFGLFCQVRSTSGGFAWDELQGLFAKRNPPTQNREREIDRRMSTDWFLAEGASQLPSDYRQTLCQSIVKGLRSYQ